MRERILVGIGNENEQSRDGSKPIRFADKIFELGVWRKPKRLHVLDNFFKAAQMAHKNIYYSDKYTDDQYEYR